MGRSKTELLENFNLFDETKEVNILSKYCNMFSRKSISDYYSYYQRKRVIENQDFKYLLDILTDPKSSIDIEIITFLVNEELSILHLGYSLKSKLIANIIKYNLDLNIYVLRINDVLNKFLVNNDLVEEYEMVFEFSEAKECFEKLKKVFSYILDISHLYYVEDQIPKSFESYLTNYESYPVLYNRYLDLESQMYSYLEDIVIDHYYYNESYKQSDEYSEERNEEEISELMDILTNIINNSLQGVIESFIRLTKQYPDFIKSDLDSLSDCLYDLISDVINNEQELTNNKISSKKLYDYVQINDNLIMLLIMEHFYYIIISLYIEFMNEKILNKEIDLNLMLDYGDDNYNIETVCNDLMNNSIFFKIYDSTLDLKAYNSKLLPETNIKERTLKGYKLEFDNDFPM